MRLLILILALGVAQAHAGAFESQAGASTLPVKAAHAVLMNDDADDEDDGTEGRKGTVPE